MYLLLLKKGTYLDSDNRLTMIKAAKCCNQHLKNIIILRHFQFCCLRFLKTEEKQSLFAVFRGLSSSFISPLPARAATPPYSCISPGHFPQLKLILSIQWPLAWLLPACHIESARILMWSVSLTSEILALLSWYPLAQRCTEATSSRQTSLLDEIQYLTVCLCW